MLAREIDRVIAGFVRGQALVSLTLGVFYAAGLVILGVNFGFLIGLVAGLISFIPYLGSTLGFVASVGIALLQFWPDWVMAGRHRDAVRRRPVARGLRPAALLHRQQCRPSSGLADVRPVRLRPAVRLRRAAGRDSRRRRRSASWSATRLARYLASPIYRGSAAEPPPPERMTRRDPGPTRQLPLSLPHEAAVGRDDFIVGRANAEAIEIDRPLAGLAGARASCSSARPARENRT